MTVSRRIWQARRDEGMSIEDLAKRTGMETDVVRQIEEEHAAPQIEDIEAIAEALGIAPQSLVAEDSDECGAIRPGRVAIWWHRRRDMCDWCGLMSDHVGSLVEERQRGEASDKTLCQVCRFCLGTLKDVLNGMDYVR